MTHRQHMALLAFELNPNDFILKFTTAGEKERITDEQQKVLDEQSKARWRALLGRKGAT